MNQLILRNLEERMVAEENSQYHPGSGGREHSRAHHGRVEIAGDLFERKQHGRQGRIECRRNGGGRPYRYESLDLLGRQSEQASSYGADARTYLNRRSFAPEWDSAGQRDGRAEEFAEHGAERDAASTRKKRGFRLRNAAATRVRKIAIEQVSDAERTDDREKQSPPRGAVCWVETHPQMFGQQDKCDHS